MFERVSAVFHKYLLSLVSVDGNFCTVLGRTPHEGCIPTDVQKAKTQRGSQVSNEKTRHPNVNNTTNPTATATDSDYIAGDGSFGGVATSSGDGSLGGMATSSGDGSLEGVSTSSGGNGTIDNVVVDTTSGGGEDATVMLALNADAFVEAAVEDNRPFLQRFVRTSAFADWLVRHSVPY